MEVLLKMRKITNAIMKQTVSATLSDMMSYDILGWCLYSNETYIVMSNGNGLLKRLILTDTITWSQNWHNTPRLVLNGIRYNSFVEFDTEFDSLEYQRIYKKIYDIAIEKGQFYIC